MIGSEGRSHTDWVIRCIGDEVDVCSGQFAANETDVVVVAFEPEVGRCGFVQGVSKRRFIPHEGRFGTIKELAREGRDLGETLPVCIHRGSAPGGDDLSSGSDVSAESYGEFEAGCGWLAE